MRPDSRTVQRKSKDFVIMDKQDISFKLKRNILMLDNLSRHKGKNIKWGYFESLIVPLYSPDPNLIQPYTIQKKLKRNAI